MQHNKPLTIVFTGPESTAKSTLSKQLSEALDAYWVPEYARDYIEKLNRPYTFDDVHAIARQQKDAYDMAMSSGKSIVIFDTYLIITKVWFMEVYGKMPEWIDEELANLNIDLHLLCYPDIQWVADGVRENEMKREYLFQLYKNELETYNFAYEVIKGEGQERLHQANYHINHFINHQFNNDHHRPLFSNQKGH
jgi:NadR type nicotinamide-nucleotide adenylyltransferase